MNGLPTPADALPGMDAEWFAKHLGFTLQPYQRAMLEQLVDAHRVGPQLVARRPATSVAALTGKNPGRINSDEG